MSGFEKCSKYLNAT